MHVSYQCYSTPLSNPVATLGWPPLTTLPRLPDDLGMVLAMDLVPVRWAYPRSQRGGPCRNWIAVEWRRCGWRDRMTRYEYGHTLKPHLRRWQPLTRSNQTVDVEQSGVGIFRLRPRGRALLYRNGSVRKSTDVAAIAATGSAQGWACASRPGQSHAYAGTGDPMCPFRVPQAARKIVISMGTIVRPGRRPAGRLGRLGLDGGGP